MYDELTQVDMDKLRAELEHRTRVLMPQLIEQVKIARGFGDLSENFEYKAAKQELNRNKSRVRYLERMIKTAKVISVKNTGGIRLFDRVTIWIGSMNREQSFQLVTTLRQNPIKGLVSKESPIGQALLGKRVGDTVHIQVNEAYGYDAEIRAVEHGEDDENIPISNF